MKSLRILLACLLIACLCTACTITVREAAPTSGEPDPETSPVGGSPTPTDDWVSAAPVTPSPASDPSEGSPNTVPYTEHSFRIQDSALDNPTGIVPEGKFLLITNNVLQGTGIFSDDTEAVFVFDVSYSVDAPVTGTLYFKVTREGDSTEIYEYTTTLEFAAEGTNTMSLLVNTTGVLSGTYSVEWYIDDCLAFRGSTTK